MADCHYLNEVKPICCTFLFHLQAEFYDGWDWVGLIWKGDLPFETVGPGGRGITEVAGVAEVVGVAEVTS